MPCGMGLVHKSSLQVLNTCDSIKTRFGIDVEDERVKEIAEVVAVHKEAWTTYLEPMSCRAIETVKEKAKLRKMILALEQLARENNIIWVEAKRGNDWKLG